MPKYEVELRRTEVTVAKVMVEANSATKAIVFAQHRLDDWGWEKVVGAHGWTLDTAEQAYKAKLYPEDQ